jgi:hypothetical protein
MAARARQLLQRMDPAGGMASASRLVISLMQIFTATKKGASARATPEPWETEDSDDGWDSFATESDGSSAPVTPTIQDAKGSEMFFNALRVPQSTPFEEDKHSKVSSALRVQFDD